jgi:hypothetical protein
LRGASQRPETASRAALAAGAESSKRKQKPTDGCPWAWTVDRQRSQCEREDLNLHGIAPASPSSWCVCQFRHARVGHALRALLLRWTQPSRKQFARMCLLVGVPALAGTRPPKGGTPTWRRSIIDVGGQFATASPAPDRLTSATLPRRNRRRGGGRLRG